MSRDRLNDLLALLVSAVLLAFFTIGPAWFVARALGPP